MDQANEDIGHGAASTAPNGEQEEIKNQIFGIHFRVRCALRYCKKRCKTFETLHNVCSFIALFGGSAAVGSIVKYPVVATVCGLFAAGFFAAKSVIDFSRRCEQYKNLHNAFNALCLKLETQAPSAQLVIEAQKEMASIQKEVPATLRVLDVLCHNQEATAQGLDDHYEIHWWHILLMNVWAFENWQPKRVSKAESAPTAIQG